MNSETIVKNLLSIYRKNGNKPFRHGLTYNQHALQRFRTALRYTSVECKHHYYEHVPIYWFYA